jgi:5-methylcytosine-specific restriction endonuclease McrA
MASKSIAKEDPAHAARHCLAGGPYERIKFAKMNGRTLLYCVDESDRGLLGAKKALKEAFHLHRGNCFYCKKPVGATKLSLDHVEPEMLKRNGHLQNLVIAHKKCNAEKGHRPIEAYDPDAGREWLSALLKQVQDRLNRL